MQVYQYNEQVFHASVVISTIMAVHNVVLVLRWLLFHGTICSVGSSFPWFFKGHSQLPHMHNTYYFIANLHLTEMW